MLPGINVKLPKAEVEEKIKQRNQIKEQKLLGKRVSW